MPVVTVRFERQDCSIYDCRKLIGRYIQTGPKVFIAYDLHGRRLGEFQKQRDAYCAVGAAFEHGSSQ